MAADGGVKAVEDQGKAAPAPDLPWPAVPVLLKLKWVVRPQLVNVAAAPQLKARSLSFFESEERQPNTSKMQCPEEDCNGRHCL